MSAARFGLLDALPGVHVDPVAGRLESAGTHPPRLESNTIGSPTGLAERAAMVGCVVEFGMYIWVCASAAEAEAEREGESVEQARSWRRRWRVCGWE